LAYPDGRFLGRPEDRGVVGQRVYAIPLDGSAETFYLAAGAALQRHTDEVDECEEPVYRERSAGAESQRIGMGKS
jgi:hypothetical protein